ncbi:hypothetical protein BDV25DRAFT_139224 [Aspergillus avenaceus]|uniref:C2H2-type domain-containing protein n=1 Tax=Aspergillus avenaceus TaxID=36643 RepID=A0A5N6TXM5_ASPAV|nr:hypothetical protein BDV25DRAFT_139224 [Aspergillus avenaceus]
MARASTGCLEKSHTCQYCQRNFRRLEHLQRHVRLHTKERPYACSCGEAFARRDLLKRHHRVVHNEDPPPAPPSTSKVRRQSLPGSTVNPQRELPAFNADVASPSLNPHLSATVNASLPNGDRPSDAQISTPPDLLNGGGIGGDVELYDSGPVGMLPDTHYAYDAVEDFTSFVNSMGLAFDFDSLIDPQCLLPVHEAPSGVPHSEHNHPNARQSSRPDYDEEQSEPANRPQSPTLLPIPLNTAAVQAAVYIPLLKITEAQRTNLLQAHVPFQHLMPGFTLPSRDSLTRYLNAYFEGVYPHMTFMHGPSFRPDEHPLELILGMTALGAQYRYEHRKSLMLYYASKTIFLERQRLKEAALINRHMSRPLTVDPDPYSPCPTPGDDIRCLLNLVVFATWQQDPEIVKDGCSLQSLLVRLMRESGLVETDIPDSDTLDWPTWLQLELDRRVKLFAFAFLNVQSIVYNIPPILLSDEINLRLPSTCEEWRTVGETHWREVRQKVDQEQSFFQDALKFILESKDPPSSISPIPSPSSSIILIHALIHRILLSQQASVAGTTPPVDIFENALRRWTSTWQLAPESSLDPLNPNGPIPFTSTALLGLAYVRLQLDLGPCRMLASRDPQKISSTLLHSAPLVRGRRLLPALLHATHALSIPVKLGLEYVSRSQAFVWSIQHALCGLEFAVLLSKWLQAVGRTQQQHPLEEHEQRLLNWVRRIVEEGRNSLDDEDTTSDLDCDRLAFFVVRLWARIMRGNAQWPFVDIIGHSLEMYAEHSLPSSMDQ